MIEVFFRVLKSGCRVEERRFEQIDRLLTCLAVYLIVAWRTLYVCRLGRSCPEISCESVFEPAEWRAAWKVVRREDPPQQVPSLDVVVNLIAQLGGYINRKRSDPGLARKPSGSACSKSTTSPCAENYSALRPRMTWNLCKTTRQTPWER